MTNRLIAIVAATVMALVSAFGGVALANTARHHAHATHHKAHATSEEEPGSEEPGAEEPGDGPGGHEDEPGAEVDNQFEGEQ